MENSLKEDLELAIKFLSNRKRNASDVCKKSKQFLVAVNTASEVEAVLTMVLDGTFRQFYDKQLSLHESKLG